MKVLYYPQLSSEPNHELSMLSGSTKRIVKNYLLDKLQRYFFKEHKIYQSNFNATLFDSSIIHSAISSPIKSKGSFRLIYNFCEESQLESFPRRLFVRCQGLSLLLFYLQLWWLFMTYR